MSPPRSGAQRKRRLRLAWALALATVLGCGARTPTVSAPQALLADPTVLRVGTSGDYPPFSSVGPAGDREGFDIAVAEAYARESGRRIVFVPFRWPELAARLAAGDFDVAMSGITVRPDRLLVGTMTAAVARAEAVLVVRPGAGNTRARPGLRVGVNRGGHLERVARARLPRATLVPVDDNRALGDLLTAGAVDAVVTDTLELATFTAPFQVAARLSQDRKAYWVRPGDHELARDLDRWLLDRERDGTLQGLRDRHLGRTLRPTLAPELARLVDLVARRLMVMPLVAAAKRAAGLPVEDAARERDIDRVATARARAGRFPPEAYLDFVRAERAAAKVVQRMAPESSEPAPALGELRVALDRLDAAIDDALQDAAPSRVAPEKIQAALLVDADLPARSDRVLADIARALHRLLLTSDD